MELIEAIAQWNKTGWKQSADLDRITKDGFVPLKLSFAKTIHTYQGQQAGKVRQGPPPNAVERIIYDSGTRRFEGQNPGLFYTLLSRITTLGEPPFHNDSATCFLGPNMNKTRIKNIDIKHIDNHGTKIYYSYYKEKNGLNT